MPIRTCPNCHKKFTLGETGTIDGCDSCLGVERDTVGHAWYPGETAHVYQLVSNPNCYVWKMRPTAIKAAQANGKGHVQ